MARPGLTQHRKFRRLERAVGSHALARGLLETMWDVCYQNGDPFLGDSDDVEAAARWDGEPGKLTNALLDAGGDMGTGFIEEVPGRPRQYQVHDLYHHAPDYVRKRRSREAARRAKTDPVAENDQQTADADRSLTGQWQPSPDCRDGVDVTCAPAPAPAPNKEKAISSNPSGFDQTVNDVFAYYLEKVERNPKTYELTAWRKKKGVARLRECLAKTGYDVTNAVALMKHTVDKLTESDFHMGRDPKTSGKRYCDWETHLFGSYERMERWWNQAPTVSVNKSNGHATLSEVPA